jgi:hypothetical protein
LSHLSSDDKFTWDDSVPLVTLAINTAFQTSINDVPFFLFHGRDAHLPFGDFLSKQPINYASDTNYAAEMSLRLSNAFSQVRKQSKIAHDKSAQYYDKTANSKHITPGSLVLLRNETSKTENPQGWPTQIHWSV